ncbi:MAG: hypothetical protein C0515_08705 [Novosphingobium sp.]|nr:hypothetical protein [Novosphingobium sp.]
MFEKLVMLLLIAALSGFLILLLIHCLRVGQIGSGTLFGLKDYDRKRQPIRFWGSIASLALAAVVSTAVLVQSLAELILPTPT